MILPDNLDPDRRYGFKLTDIDGETTHNFYWPMTPGVEVSAPEYRILYSNIGFCPLQEGDGLCVAHSWSGAQSGGQRARCMVLVSYLPHDLLSAPGPDKVRVRRVRIESGPLDVEKMVREGRLRELRCISLHGASLHGLHLEDLDITGANFTRARLSTSNLKGVKALGANFSLAEVGSTVFHNALLSDSTFYKVLASYADFSKAILVGAIMRDGDFIYANFRGADLRYADLRGSNLYEANFAGADLRNVTVDHRTNLRNAKGVSSDFLGIHPEFRSQVFNV